MACDITSGRAKQCKEFLGGVQKLYLFNYLENPFTVVDGAATAMNVLLTEAFEYDLVGDGQVLVEDMVSDRATGTTVNTQTVTAILQGLDVATSNEMKAVANGYPQAVVKDRNNNYIVVGYSEGIDFTVNSTTGSTQAELNGYTLTGVALEGALGAYLDETTRDAFLAIVQAN